MIGSRAATRRRRRPSPLERLRGKLLAMRRELEGRLSHAVEAERGAMPPGVEDEADMAATLLEREVCGEVGGVFSGTIAEIDLALDNLAAGTYGVCEECGRRIALERLKALPWATLCVRCKRQHEAEATERPGPREHWLAMQFHKLCTSDTDDERLGLRGRRLG